MPRAKHGGNAIFMLHPSQLFCSYDFAPSVNLFMKLLMLIKALIDNFFGAFPANPSDYYYCVW